VSASASAYLANEAVVFYLIFCADEAKKMADRRDETLADMIAGKLGLLEQGDLDALPSEGGGGV